MSLKKHEIIYKIFWICSMVNLRKIPSQFLKSNNPLLYLNLQPRCYSYHLSRHYQLCLQEYLHHHRCLNFITLWLPQLPLSPLIHFKPPCFNLILKSHNCLGFVCTYLHSLYYQHMFLIRFWSIHHLFQILVFLFLPLRLLLLHLSLQLLKKFFPQILLFLRQLPIFLCLCLPLL